MHDTFLSHGNKPCVPKHVVRRLLMQDAYGGDLVKPLEMVKEHFFFFKMILKMVCLNRVPKSIVLVHDSKFLKYFCNALWRERGTKLFVNTLSRRMVEKSQID